MSVRPLSSRKRPLSSVREGTISVTPLESYGNDWLLDCELRQLSPQTRSLRRLILEKLAWYLRQNGHDQCGLRELRAFLAYLGRVPAPSEGRWGNSTLKQVARPATIHTYFAHLRTFFRWLVAEGEIEVSPMETLRPPIARTDQVQPFTEAQVAALLAAARKSRFPRRNEALLLFMLDTGARASEVCGLRMRDLDLPGRHCIVTGKGNKRRSLFLSPATLRALTAYLRDEPHGPDDPLFASHGRAAVGEPMTRSGLLQVMERLGPVAGIEAVRCSPHTFRHTFAVSFIRNGGNVFSLQQLLGHTSLTMSNRYVALAQADLERQHGQFSPVAMRTRG